MNKASREITVLLITDNSVGRIDARLQGTLEIAHFRKELCQSSLGIEAKAELAIALSQKSHGKIWVLCDRFWTGIVELEVNVVNAIPEDQLSLAIGLEAEFDSGLSPFESSIAYLPTQSSSSSGPPWTVVQCGLADINEIRNGLGRNLRKLRGFAAIPTELIKILEIADQTVELTEATTCKLADCLLPIVDEERNKKVVPVVINQGTPKKPAYWNKLSLAACTVASVILFVIHAAGKWQEQRLRTELVALTAEESRLNQEGKIFTASLKTLELKLLEKSTALSVQQRKQDLATFTERQRDIERRLPLLLLDSLARTASDEHQITNIICSDGQICIEGLAINSKAVRDLSESLEVEFKNYDRIVKPAEISAANPQSITRFRIRILADVRSDGREISTAPRALEASGRV